MAFSLGQLALGIVILYFGAEWLVRGAADLARSFGIPTLIIGLTVVGYGTSAPEMTVSIVAAVRGNSAISLGNVVGSNIANLGLILGITAFIARPRTDGAMMRRELPLLLLSTAALPLVLWDGRVSRFEGGALLGVAAAFTVWLVADARRARALSRSTLTSAAPPAGSLSPDGAHDSSGPSEPSLRSRLLLVGLALAGLALLVIGGEIFVRGAVGLARRMGIDDRVIGLTVVAIGTSLPELATSLVAAARGHAELAVGNVVGSNLYNILLVLGATAVVRPVDGSLLAMRLDLGVLAVLTLFAVVVLRRERTLRRWEGTVLLASYVMFLAALVLGW